MQSILEIRHLKTLQALKEAGNLLRAAALLNVTQSALSHQIKQLEDHHGTPLFERKSVPVRFTPAGERLLKLAASVLPQIDQTERDLARLQQDAGGKLRLAIGCLPGTDDWLLPALDALRSRWPDVALEIVSTPAADAPGLLREDRADLAIVADAIAHKHVDQHLLFGFELVALLSRGHALADKAHLEAQDFAGEALAVYPSPADLPEALRRLFKSAGVKPARRPAAAPLSLLQLVAGERGIAILPAWAAQGYADRGHAMVKRITAGGLPCTVHAACKPELSAKPWLADFLDILRRTAYLNLPEVQLPDLSGARQS
ncbi:LysR substrate-binding domain-containing protein [Herbaspirillum robiniae]|uniref:LysR substrate-binding domain-containing protein n=1 Tax=Herbaspirillum robiniae TaxID=2014887 RepID=UPI003D78520B